MTAMVRKYILAPLTVMAEILQKKRHANIFELSLQDTGGILQLTVKRAYVALSLYGSSFGGRGSAPHSNIIQEGFEASSSASTAGQDGEVAA